MHRNPIVIATLAITLAACSGGADSASGGRPCAASAGGHLSLSERADMVYTVSFRKDSGGRDVAHIESVIVGRGTAGWKTARRSSPPPPQSTPDSMTLATSANLGVVRVGYDRRSNAAWIHDHRVALDSFNVILIDRVDSVGGAPEVGRRLRIAPTFSLPPDACNAPATPTSLSWADSIRARLMRSPEVRAFAMP